MVGLLLGLMMRFISPWSVITKKRRGSMGSQTKATLYLDVTSSNQFIQRDPSHTVRRVPECCS